MVNKKSSKKTAFGGGLLVGGSSQLSKNKNIKNVGGLVLYATVMGAIGECIVWLIKWIIWEPIKLCWKLFWACTVFACKMFWRLTVISFIVLKKEILKFYNYFKIKYISKKAVE